MAGLCGGGAASDAELGDTEGVAADGGAETGADEGEGGGGAEAGCNRLCRIEFISSLLLTGLASWACFAGAAAFFFLIFFFTLAFGGASILDLAEGSVAAGSSCCAITTGT
ncbi:MAG: hypothetical protein HY053_08030 [Proteobacteria bacterium]|nr:hypothetical protein [Pseudomonadota bacterium]